MKLLYSNILPAKLNERQTTIVDCFNEQIEACDGVDIAVGYVSKAALEELDILITEHSIGYVSLVIGMYYVEGMPEGIYRTAVALNEKWRVAGVGEIRMVKAFKEREELFIIFCTCL